MASARDVAEWMVEQLEKVNRLSQYSAAHRIRKDFGGEFTYKNKNGNLAISKEVLEEFNELTEDVVVWVRGDRCWRKRKPSDKPGREQR